MLNKTIITISIHLFQQIRRFSLISTPMISTRSISLITQVKHLKVFVLPAQRISLPSKRLVCLNRLGKSFSVNIAIIQLLIHITWKPILVSILVICFSVNIAIIKLLILRTWKHIVGNTLALCFTVNIVISQLIILVT